MSYQCTTDNVQNKVGMISLTSITGYPKQLHILGLKSVQSAESEPTFRRNMSPPSSGSKNKLSVTQVASKALGKTLEAGQNGRSQHSSEPRTTELKFQ
jgi:hypothetical protein